MKGRPRLGRATVDSPQQESLAKKNADTQPRMITRKLEREWVLLARSTQRLRSGEARDTPWCKETKGRAFRDGRLDRARV